jgi:hypothetical protein
MENKPKRGRPAKAKAEVIDVEVAKDGKQETGIEIFFIGVTNSKV